MAQIVKEFHLDEPMLQPLHAVAERCRSAATSVGRRSRARQVSTAIAKAIPVSLQLMLYAQIVALVLAVPLGVYAAYRANRRGDRVASTVALAALSVPNFVLAVVLVLFFAIGGLSVFGHQVGWRDAPRRRATCRSGRIPSSTSSTWRCRPSRWRSARRPATCGCCDRT